MNSLLPSTRNALGFCAALLLLSACSRAPKPDAPTAPSAPKSRAGTSVDASTTDQAPPPPTPPAPATPDPAAPGDPASGEAPPSLLQVREALGQWVFQHNNPPKDLNELVKAGYLKRLPVPPAGKKFAFDPHTMSVSLVD